MKNLLDQSNANFRVALWDRGTRGKRFVLAITNLDDDTIMERFYTLESEARATAEEWLRYPLYAQN